MGADSKIEWCRHTLNPWRGCSRVHAGCDNCYAETMSHRNPATLGVWGDAGTRVIASEAMWREPMKWDRLAKEAGERHRVFCASLADVFEDYPNQLKCSNGQWAVKRHQHGKFLDYYGCNLKGGNDALHLEHVRSRLFGLIDQTPNLDWLLLTKRPENIRRMWPWGWGTAETLDKRPEFNPSAFEPDVMLKKQPAYRSNVWLLTSVSNQATADAMIPPLLECRDLCPVLGLSMEPMLGPVDITQHLKRDSIPCPDGRPGCEVLHLGPSKIDWVIVGGESGPTSRPMHPLWVRDIRNQCQEAGVPFFFKQWGELAPLGPTSGLDPDHHYPGRDKRLSVYSGIPMDEPTSMFKIGKKNAGRMLDGRTWDEYPEVGV